MEDVIEIFGKRLKIVTDENNRAEMCERCALDAEGKMNRHFEEVID